MSRRVRNSAGTAEEAHPAGARAGAADTPAASWNVLFHGFSADDQARILEQSCRDGVIYAHQLPDSRTARKPEQRATKPFATVLPDRTQQLPPNIPAALVFRDEQLDRWQKDAVQKALSTPELFLLTGNPGSGKSRVVTEIIHQAMQRGQRVLFIARESLAIDCVLNWLDAEHANLTLCCLEQDHAGEQAAARNQRCLLNNRVSELRTRTMEAGKREHAEVTRVITSLDAALTTLPALQETVQGSLELDQSRRNLESRRNQLDSELQSLSDVLPAAQSPDSIVQMLASLKQESADRAGEANATISRVESALAASKEELARLHAEFNSLEPLRRAWAGRRFWTPDWWKALRNADKRRRADVLALQIEGLEKSAQQQIKELDAVRTQQQQTQDRIDAARAAALTQERSRRENLFNSELAELNQRMDQLTKLLSEHLEKLALLTGHPLAAPLDFDQVRASLIERKHQAEKRLDRAGRWLALIDERPQILQDALIEHTLLIAGTAAAWSTERKLASRFGDRSFEYLILEDADQFSEAEAAGLARLARHWVLVGCDHPIGPNHAPAVQTSIRTGGPAASSSPTFFAEFWQRLHQSPLKLPYSWVEEKNQIVCRLRPVPPEQRTWIEVERLADHPQIVLHILALPRSEPVVAEVLFPASFTIEKAKQFILQELQELAIHASEGSLRWFDEHADRLVLQLANESCHHHATVELAPGVREQVHPCSFGPGGAASSVAWRTCCIEFEYQAGWQRHSAEDWIERHLGLRDLGRAVQLDTVHRQSAGLASFVKHLLASQAGVPANNSAKREDWNSEAVDFVAVPPGHEGSAVDTGTGPGRPKSAGFELDLSNSRNRERLPFDLRTGLPNQGFVNLAEAQAVVRRLEELAGATARPDIPSALSNVFVIALYEAQAELIRKLIRNSPRLAGYSNTIEVGVPPEFEHREAEQVLLSLTRSHSHRATPFGSSTRDLLTALTRAQNRLVVFGDHGALARRAQWDGVLERTDSSQAARERSLVNSLLAHPRISIPQRLVPVGAEGQAP